MPSATAVNSLKERLDVLDFLRGIAVLGIFVINIESFAFAYPFNPWRYGFVEDIDRDVRFWTYFLFQGKFFSMFALLFGIGFYLFLEKAARFGHHAVDLYAHRMFWLFVLGALHACLLWPGDILYHYAVCGLLLLPARILRGWQLGTCIAFLVLLIGWQSVTATGQTIERQAVYHSALATQAAQRSQKERQTIERWEARHSPKEALAPDDNSPRLGGYLSNVNANLESVELTDGRIFYGNILFRTLLLMLIGVALYRLGVFHNYRNLNGYWAASLALLAIGLAANYSRLWTWTYEYFNPITSYSVALAHAFSKETLGVAYILLFNGLFQKFLRNWSANPLCRVGRMALTNYLLQSVLAGLIFYGYGLGLHGSVPRSQLWPFILTIWALLLASSVVWLRYFQQGPVEALWRKLMYATSRADSRSDPAPVDISR